MNIESSLPATLLLLRGNRHAYARGAATTHLVKQGSVTAANVQDAGAFSATDLIQKIANLIVLCLFIRERRITVVKTFGVVENACPAEYVFPEFITNDRCLRGRSVRG